ncbi:hypothetical protein C8R45DRAFT_1086990 [Mycena sanguinolenta]|nr:hypothetical protein C8R45DRAFT_1086990 [Mycena sanguinolenta]
MLADLPMQCPPAVGLEMDADKYTHWAASFPRLHSKNLLRRADSGWFEAQLRRRDSSLNNV